MTSTLYRVDRSVAHITLNRPEAHNAIDPSMMQGLAGGIDRASVDESVRAVVIRGSGGRAFSAGVDLKYFQAQGVMADAGKNLRFTAEIRDLMLAVEQSPVPTIAVVEGFALAGGLELALACDFLICADDAQIGDQHANYDLMPGAGGTQRLPRRIGTQRALELLLTGRRVDGPEAVRIGLALRSVPAEELDDEVERLLAGLRDKSRVGLGLMRRAVERGLEMTLRDGLDFERLTTQEYFSCHGAAVAGLGEFNARKKEQQ